MIKYILASVCSLPIMITLCDLITGSHSTIGHWWLWQPNWIQLVPRAELSAQLQRLRQALTAQLHKSYSWYLNYHVEKAQQKTELAHYRTVYLSDDQLGPYVILEGKKIYLKAMRAQPLKGFLAGDNYYTTVESEKFEKVVDETF